MVLSDPRVTRAASLALRLIRQALSQGHRLDTAFFYHSGAYMAVNPHPEQPEWRALALHSGLECLVCGSALVRQGLADHPLIDPWRRAGLGEWLAAAMRSDRILRFGGWE